MASRLRIKKLSLQGFRSFSDKQTVTFPKAGLVGIRGKSGAGKTTLFVAICYVLGILRAPFTATKLKCKWDKIPLQVDLELDSDQGPVLLRRGKVNSIKVGDEPEIAGAVKAIDERLERLVGDSDLLRALIYRQQRTPGSFLTMKDADKKSFLAKLLGTEELEQQMEATVNTTAKLRYEMGKLEASKATLQAQFKTITEVVLTTTADLDTDKLTVEEAYTLALELQNEKAHELRHAETEGQTQWNAVRAEWAQKKTEFQAQIQTRLASRPPRPLVEESDIAKKLREAGEACKGRIATQEKVRQEAVASAQKARDASQTQLRKLQEVVSKEPNLQRQLTKVRADIASARAAECPTCEQSWTSIADKLQEWEKLETDLQAGLVTVQTAQESLPEAQSAVTRATEALAAATNDDSVTKIRSLQAEIQQRLSAELASLNAASSLYDAQMKAEDQEIANERRAFELEASKALLASDQALREMLAVKKAAFEEFRTQANTLHARMERLQQDIDNIAFRNSMEKERLVRDLEHNAKVEQQIAAVDVQFAQFTKELNAEYDFAAVMKGFLGAIFDEVLAEISTEANDLLKELKNVATTTITFCSDRITDKGTVKQQIRPVVIKGGVELDPEVELSGGQGASLELAVDLALGRVIGRRTGRRPNFYMIDEGFDGMDLSVKEGCLEVLAKVAHDTQILIIDHSSEFKESFTSFVDVESTNEISRIV